VYDNRYVYYDGSEAVAVWTFRDDGVCVKEGIVINGPVRIYSRPGVLFAEVNYVNGARDGICRYYYPDGGVMYSGYYRRGYMSGGWNSYRNNGEISASYKFHGNETQMPAHFAPPRDPDSRHGFDSLQLEGSYAGKKVITKPSVNVAAVQQHSTNSFGVLTPDNQHNRISGATAGAGRTEPGAGNVNGRPSNVAANAAPKPGSIQGAAAKPGNTAGKEVTNNAPNAVQNKAAKMKSVSNPSAVVSGKPSGHKAPDQNNKHIKNDKKHVDKKDQSKEKVKPAPQNTDKETGDKKKEN
jgi:hypothetical protein